ncbi:MAG: hypothetical protein U1F48_06360 [Burkholderiales bacterium]
MYYEPETLWGRTVQGDRELARPAIGLSLVQRRLLKKLGRPRPFATLAASLRIDAHKLEHELVRLAELELVAFQRPGAPVPRTAPGRMPRIDLVLPRSGAPTDPFHSAARAGWWDRLRARTPGHAWQPPMLVYVGAAACGMAVVLVLLV